MLNRMYLAYLSSLLKDTGIRASDSIILTNIIVRRGISQDDLSRSLAIDKAAVARSVHTLEMAGYITRELSPSDKRRKHLQPSESGMKLQAKIDIHNKNWTIQAFRGVAPEQQSAFEETVDKIRGNLLNLHANY